MATKKKRHRKTKGKKRLTAKRKTTAKKRKSTKRKAHKKKRHSKKALHGLTTAATRPIPPGTLRKWKVETLLMPNTIPTIGIQPIPQSKFTIRAGNVLQKDNDVHWNDPAPTVQFQPIPINDIVPPQFVLRAEHVQVPGGATFRIDLGINAGKLEFTANPDAGGGHDGGSGTAGRSN